MESSKKKMTTSKLIMKTLNKLNERLKNMENRLKNIEQICSDFSKKNSNNFEESFKATNKQAVKSGNILIEIYNDCLLIKGETYDKKDTIKVSFPFTVTPEVINKLIIGDIGSPSRNCPMIGN